MSASARTATARNQTYVANMSALRRLDPTLAGQIDQLAPHDLLPTEPSRRGPPTIALTTPDGRRIFLHSRYDPAAEAERFVKAINTEDNFCFVVSGFGLGYHFKALHARLTGQTVVIVVEPSLELIKTALSHTDLTELLSSRRFVILTSPDPTRLHERLNPHAPIMLLGMRFVTHPASQRVAPQFHATMRKAITDYLAYGRTSLVTLVAISRRTAANIAANLPTYVATPPIDSLRDHFARYPGLVISAGPSLARNIDRLAGAKGRAVLIAVQTVFKPLLERDIVPDFVTSLDYSEVSARFFEGIRDFRDVHLIAEPKANWKVIDGYAGPISLLDNDFARLCLGEELGARAGLKAGATVAHLAFYLAQFLGCDPIIFVGQDLAYTEHLFYAPGVALHRAWRPEMHRFYPLETKEWEQILRRRPILRRVQDIHGDEIFTDETLFTYLQQFESDFGAAGPVRVIDATEGGARKRGCETMTLQDALTRFARRPIPSQKFEYRKLLNWCDPRKLPAARKALGERVNEIQRLRDISEQTLALLQELTTLTGKPAKFNRRLIRLDELRALVREQDRIYGMITSICQLAELRKLSADLRLDRLANANAARAKRQLQRDIEFVKDFIAAAGDLEGILRDSIRRFDAVMARQATPAGEAP